MVSGGRVCFRIEEVGCEVADLRDFDEEGFVVTEFSVYCCGDSGC